MARVAVVTGAGTGIGEGIARCLAREGMTVVVAELNQATGEAVASKLEKLGGRGRFIATDVTDLASVDAMMQQVLNEFGRVDVLVNNAYPTNSLPAAALEQDDERLERAFTAGFRAAVRTMKLAQPGMAAQRWGRIINICSLNGVNAHPMTVDYNSAKEALRAYTRTVAVEWAKDGITANVICPGAATSAYKMMEEFAPQMIGDILKLVPMGYMGDPEADIGPVATFLASEGSRYMTGNTLFVDGGGHINGVPWRPEG
ncbi:SDR family NAD(P)-dependent oxidoreductase [Litorivivens sp.]|uniref:SDR family NAD(P)-dependent oxidoreductase n=1 Tax=Litorivivens sp. TaxID=2020868 RepID=UPI00356A90BA